MLIDGKALAEKRILSMRTYLEAKNASPLLVALAIDPDVPTRQFLKIKARVADRIGVRMETVELSGDTSKGDIESAFAAALERADGIVLQLPYPQSAPTEELLSNLPSDLDPDCLGVRAGGLFRSGEHIILPPVVSALDIIAKEHRIALPGAHAVVVGQGRLVGAPAALWLERMGSEVTRLTKADSLDAVKGADILVLGAGAPGLITSDLLKTGVVIFDAGTSEEGGKVVGDADPACAEKASLVTPVPGGIGPVAVAELFRNLLTLKFDYEPSA